MDAHEAYMETVRDAGYAARYDGLPRLGNPHIAGSNAAEAWCYGWLQADEAIAESQPDPEEWQPGARDLEGCGRDW